jgi:spoIIIJ-associated protein
MTEEREFEGKDLEEALARAAATLEVPQEDLHYEMLEAGRKGLLGLGVRNVRIRVKPPLEVEEPVEETEPGPPETKDAAKRTRGPKRARRGSRRSGRGSKDSRGATGAESNPGPAPKPAREPLDEAVVQDVRDTVVGIVEAAGLELEVEASSEAGNVQLRMKGPDEQKLVEKSAHLLGAFQLLLNRMSRRTWPDARRINVVCEGQTTPRDEELIALANKAAKQVARTGKTRKLQPMNAYERRLVHLAVREFPGLTSSSDGRGAVKRVRISKIRNQI